MAQQKKLGLGWRIHDFLCPVWRFRWYRWGFMKLMCSLCRARLRMG